MEKISIMIQPYMNISITDIESGICFSQHYGSLILVIMIVVLLSGCAGQRPPDGGPIDTTPPEIVSVSPAPNTTNFSDSRIAFEFSKYVDRRSAEESIFISPFIRDVEFDWSGREVEVNFLGKLRKNTTYVVTVGTDVVDLNNRNRMAHAFSFAFSTGTQIDRGEIRGKIYDPSPSGVLIFAYRLDGLNPDTLNPMTQKPDYITQAGTSGEYTLPHLGFATYRVIALKDEFRNLLYDPETDAMSTAPTDILLTESDSLHADLNFSLSVEDTTAPRLVSAVARDERHVELKFSENLDSSSVSLKDFAVTDTGQTRTVRIEYALFRTENAAFVDLITEPLRRDSLFRVFAMAVRDLHGHRINPLAMSKQFSRAPLRDTIPPRLLFSTILDSTERMPVTQQFRFEFDDALQRESAEHAIRLRGRDSVNIPLSFVWSSAAGFTVVPLRDLQAKSSYTFQIRFDSLRDEVGNHWKDSVRVFRFQTIDPEQLSSIEGMILDTASTLVDRYIVVAENDRERTRKPLQVAARRGKKFLFSDIREGEYRLRAFQDIDGSGAYSSGKPYPFNPSERFAVYQDSIKVRARWPVEGVLIKFK